MLRFRSLRWGCLLLATVGCSSDSSGTCEAGSERCDCYGNGTCDEGLECRSDLCVASAATGGSGDGGSAAGGAEIGGSGEGGTTTSAGGTTTSAGGTTTSAGGTTSVGGSSAVANCPAEGQSCNAGLDCSGESCCKSLFVPGGSFDRYAFALGPYHATVNKFCMDKYEVTVGRFKKFLAAYDTWIAGGANPTASAGAHATGASSGWQTAWNSQLPSSADVFKDGSHLSSGWYYKTWDAGLDNLPINYVSWYEAFAFCIWDGARLATEAEWQYAAVHGSENRTYPWGNTVATSTELAVFGGLWDGNGANPTFQDIAPVGSAPLGNGYWGHSDLAGSMWEWVYDGFQNYAADCANCAVTASSDGRGYRGGSYSTSSATYLNSSWRYYYAPTFRYGDLGFRCVRTAQ